MKLLLVSTEASTLAIFEPFPVGVSIRSVGDTTSSIILNRIVCWTSKTLYLIDMCCIYLVNWNPYFISRSLNMTNRMLYLVSRGNIYIC